MVSPSPYHRSRVARIPQLFIVHSTRGGAVDDETEWRATLQWFRDNPFQVSAHYVVDARGRIARVVPVHRAAFHAGEHNLYSVGVEATQPTPRTPYTEEHYVGLARVFHEVNRSLDELGWPSIPARRVWSSDEPGIIGHEDTPQGRQSGKTDPGNLFDYDRLLWWVHEGERA